MSSEDPRKVCDNNTGLWREQKPSPHYFTWQEAIDHCANLTLGEKTWRLVEAKELWTLVDLSEIHQTTAVYPPFVVDSGFYWSATTNAADSEEAWYVFFGQGEVDHFSKANDLIHAWCVSDPQGGS